MDQFVIMLFLAGGFIKMGDILSRDEGVPLFVKCLSPLFTALGFGKIGFAVWHIFGGG